MKKYPLRLLLPIFIPLGLVFWIISNFFYLDLKLTEESDVWVNYIYELQNIEIYYEGHKMPLPITLDQSFTNWGNIRGEEIIIHYIQTLKPEKFIVCRSSPKDFWIYSGFSDDFMKYGLADTLYKYDILYSVLKNKISDDLKRIAKNKRGVLRKELLVLAKKNILTDEEVRNLFQKRIISKRKADYLWHKYNYDKYIPLIELIELIIPYRTQSPLLKEYFENKEHYNPVIKRIWRIEHFLLKGLSSLMLILGIFGSFLFGWKDLLSLGYRFNARMKMYHWWHYFTLFLPKTEYRISIHFKEEYKKYIETKKQKKLQRFIGKWDKPDFINERKLKNILQYEGKQKAKIYCLERLNVYQNSSATGRIFLLKHFYDFIELSDREQKIVKSNLVYIKDISNMTLKKLSKEIILEKAKRNNPLSPFDKFLEKLPAKYYSSFYEYEFLLKDYKYRTEFIGCFVNNKEKTYLNILKKQISFLLQKLLLEEDNLAKLNNDIDNFHEEDLCLTRTVLYELKEKKLKWKIRDKYLNLVLDKNFNEVEKELSKHFSKQFDANLILDTSVYDEKAKSELDKNILKGKSFLIVANYITASKADSLIKAFEEFGASAFVITKIPRKSPKDVDIVLLMTGYMKHGIGYYFKKRFSSYLRMSHIDASIMINSICEILENQKHTHSPKIL